MSLFFHPKSNVNELAVVYNEVYIDSGDHVYAAYRDQSWIVVVRPDGVGLSIIFGRYFEIG